MRQFTIELILTLNEYKGSCTADVASASDGAAELGIGNVGGVFVVLILGCGSALILGVVEFLWNVKDLAIEEKVGDITNNGSLIINLCKIVLDFTLGSFKDGTIVRAKF